MMMAGVASNAELPPEYGKALAAADWSTMETVTVTLSDHTFTPSSIVFKEGVPTKLVLRNAGKENHYFVSEEFFGTIATRKVQSSDGEIKAPFIAAVEVYAGKTVEWFLIPMKKGTSRVLCTVKGHAERGMKGTIEVQ
ncbi:MAG TPA: cupredoxin domain-containing protein, partial [Candidatus Deferrimicrobiaceae bacterium]|nr:cupredoxin domain-containing protein [Candidatus Deferrimicrobiaceae bacterium]